MARPKKPDALTPAQRKAASRERKKAMNLVRFETEVEVLTLNVLRAVAEHASVTLSDVVTELVCAFREGGATFPLTDDPSITDPDMKGIVRDVHGFAFDNVGVEGEATTDAPSLCWVTRDCPSQGMEVNLSPEVREFLVGFKGMSASAVIETMVNARCIPVRETFVGGEDSTHAPITKDDLAYRRLMYAHPVTYTAVLTDMYALTRGDHGFFLSANKYERRRNTVIDFVRVAQGRNAPEAYGEADLNRLVSRMNDHAATVDTSRLWERYYDASFVAPIFNMGASDD